MLATAWPLQTTRRGPQAPLGIVPLSQKRKTGTFKSWIQKPDMGKPELHSSTTVTLSQRSSHCPPLDWPVLFPVGPGWPVHPSVGPGWSVHSPVGQAGLSTPLWARVGLFTPLWAQASLSTPPMGLGGLSTPLWAQAGLSTLWA